MSGTVRFRLLAVSDRLGLPDNRSLVSAVDAALAGGCDAVQLREKDLPDAELVALAAELRVVTNRRGARLLINGRPDVAREIGADGVHLPSAAPDVDAARAALGGEGIVGVSAHSLAEVAAAHLQGADYVTFGPVFSTPSKVAFGEPMGIAALRNACASVPLPVFAIGGIKPEQAGAAAAAGARIAAISALLHTADPFAAAELFLARMEPSL